MKKNKEEGTTMELFRVEHGARKHGMWYNEKGEFDPFIMQLKDGKSKHLDMTWHERYNLSNRSWFSACPSQELLQSWFSKQDVGELVENNFKLFRMEASEFVVEEFQIFYTMEGLISKEELSLEEAWGLDVPEVEITLERARNY